MMVDDVVDDGVDGADAVHLGGSHHGHICGGSLSVAYLQNDRRWRFLCQSKALWYILIIMKRQL